MHAPGELLKSAEVARPSFTPHLEKQQLFSSYVVVGVTASSDCHDVTLWNLSLSGICNVGLPSASVILTRQGPRHFHLRVYPTEWWFSKWVNQEWVKEGPSSKNKLESPLYSLKLSSLNIWVRRGYRKWQSKWMSRMRVCPEEKPLTPLSLVCWESPTLSHHTKGESNLRKNRGNETHEPKCARGKIPMPTWKYKLEKASFDIWTRPSHLGLGSSSHSPWAGEPRVRHVPQTHHSLCNRKGNWAVEPSLAPPCETGRQGRGGAQTRWASARAHQYIVLPRFPLTKLRARYWNYLTYLKSAGESSPIRKKKRENRRKIKTKITPVNDRWWCLLNCGNRKSPLLKQLLML